MSYDSYLDRKMEEAYGHPIPDDITDYECRVCGVVIGDSEYDCESDIDEDEYTSWKVWHLKCPD